MSECRLRKSRSDDASSTKLIHAADDEVLQVLAELTCDGELNVRGEPGAREMVLMAALRKFQVYLCGGGRVCVCVCQ